MTANLKNESSHASRPPHDRTDAKGEQFGVSKGARGSEKSPNADKPNASGPKAGGPKAGRSRVDGSRVDGPKNNLEQDASISSAMRFLNSLNSRSRRQSRIATNHFNPSFSQRTPDLDDATLHSQSWNSHNETPRSSLAKLNSIGITSLLDSLPANIALVHPKTLSPFHLNSAFKFGALELLKVEISPGNLRSIKLDTLLNNPVQQAKIIRAGAHSEQSFFSTIRGQELFFKCAPVISDHELVAISLIWALVTEPVDEYADIIDGEPTHAGDHAADAIAQGGSAATSYGGLDGRIARNMADLSSIATQLKRKQDLLTDAAKSITDTHQRAVALANLALAKNKTAVANMASLNRCVTQLAALECTLVDEYPDVDGLTDATQVFTDAARSLHALMMQANIQSALSQSNAATGNEAIAHSLLDITQQSRALLSRTAQASGEICRDTLNLKSFEGSLAENHREHLSLHENSRDHRREFSKLLEQQAQLLQDIQASRDPADRAEASITGTKITALNQEIVALMGKLAEVERALSINWALLRK